MSLLAVASTVQAFRFEGQVENEDQKVPDVSIVTEAPQHKENQREEKKIDPLVVDVDRRPAVEEDEAKEASSEEEEEAEGRFFLKDKLCALGLADCTNDKTFNLGGGSKRHTGQDYHHGQVQYVQPVKVVPHGNPIPAVPVGGGYSAPKPSYNPPKPSYSAPTSSSYGAPSYTAPKPSYNAPPSIDSYSAPSRPSYNAPTSDSYGAPSRPSYNAPKPSYNAPKPSYNAPTSDSYGAPSKPSYNAPSSRPSYNAPTSSYGFNRFDDDGNIDYTDGFGERDGVGHHHGNHHGSHHHGNHHESHHGDHHHGSHHQEGHRTGRAEECYCVPVNQCPTSSVMPTSGFQDYSALVDPRTLPSSGIDSILDNEESDTLDLSLETSLPEDTRSRSLKSRIQALDAAEEGEKKTSAGEGNDGIDFGELVAAAEEDKEERRRRRDAPTEEDHVEDQFPDVEGVSKSLIDFLYLFI